MTKKSLNSNQKRVIAVALVAIAAMAIGATIAVLTDAVSFSNIFGLGKSVDEYEEYFVSPDNWAPCEEIPKTAIATNRNDTPRYARMKYSEYWRVKNSTYPDSNHVDSDLALTWDDNGVTKSYAIINTQNDDKWELRNDGWYYYKTPLNKDQSTLSLLKSVTLNCDAKLVTDGSVSATATGFEGESVPTAYADANYHLYVTLQLSDEEWTVARETLYDYIASQTRGLDTGINFKYSAFLDYDGEENYNGNNDGGGNGQATRPSARPVLALIHDTYIQSGAGTLADPFILEWDN